MRRIWKHTLAMKSLQKLTMPLGARDAVLDVQLNGDDVVMWAICDETETRAERVTVLITKTGSELPERCTTETYVGTVQHPDSGDLHVFVVESQRVDS